MSRRRSRPCRYCRRWFRPSPRAGERQYACVEESCQAHRQRENERAWRAMHPGYDARRHRRLDAESTTANAATPARRSANASALAQQLVALELISPEAVAAGLRAAERRKLVAPQATVLIGLLAGLAGAEPRKSIDLAPRACYQRGHRLLKEVMPP